MTQYEYTNQYPREQADFYIDEPWCSEKLFEKIQFKGIIHDPACGTGNIIKAASTANYLVSYSDKVDRGYQRIAGMAQLAGDFFSSVPIYKQTIIQDFLADTYIYDNIVTNPPYDLDDEFVYHAITHVKYKAALLVRIAFLAGQRRYKDLYSKTPPSKALVFSKRPSMPPPGVPVGGGKTDYCWLVWDKEDTSKLTITDWII